KIAVLRPIDSEPAIVLLSPLQEIHRHVILGLLLDLSPVGPTLHVGPRKIAERLLGRGNVALRSEAVQIERRLSRAGLLHANEPFEIVGEAKPRWIIRLLIEQSETVPCGVPRTAICSRPYPCSRIARSLSRHPATSGCIPDRSCNQRGVFPS